MKKLIIAITAMGLLISAVHAYNPPVNGESFQELASPRLLSNGASSAGGGLFYANPESLIVNPALLGSEQRNVLSVAYTSMFSSNPLDKGSYGQAFGLGFLHPTKFAVYTGYMNGVFVPYADMQTGNTMNLKFGLAKEITNKLNVGMNLNSGVFWGANTDWDFSVNMGFVYNYGNLSFMKNFRYSASILELGKTYTNTTLPGLYPEKDTGIFPMIGTIKVGAAASLLETSVVKIGASLDLSTPLFMNAIADLGLQFTIKDMVYLSIADKFNLRELVNGNINVIPSVGLTVRFTFDVKNNEYLEKNGWSENEMSVTSAWKQLYGNVNAVSAGVDMNLGLKDETPPVITIKFADEE